MMRWRQRNRGLVGLVQTHLLVLIHSSCLADGGGNLKEWPTLILERFLKFSLSWTPTSFVSWGVILDHLIELKGRSLVCIRCDTGSPWVWYWITQKELKGRSMHKGGLKMCTVWYWITVGVILDHPKELKDLIAGRVWYWITCVCQLGVMDVRSDEPWIKKINHRD